MQLSSGFQLLIRKAGLGPSLGFALLSFDDTFRVASEFRRNLRKSRR